MFRTAVIITFATWMAIPASANPTIAFMERQLEVEPGVYTLSELIEIQRAGDDAAVRIDLIDRQKAAFRQAIAKEVRLHGTAGIASTSGQ